MSPILAAALIGGFASVAVALITVVGGAILQRRGKAPDDLDLVQALTDHVHDLREQLRAAEIRCAECEARESMR